MSKYVVFTNFSFGSDQIYILFPVEFFDELPFIIFFRLQKLDFPRFNDCALNYRI